MNSRRASFVVKINELRRLLTTPDIGTFARAKAMGGQYIANTSCVSVANTLYGSAAGNAEAAVYTCINDNLVLLWENFGAQYSPCINELQSLNAAFPLGDVTPTTSTEAGSSAAGDVITELPHTGPVNTTAVGVRMASLCAMTSDSINDNLCYCGKLCAQYSPCINEFQSLNAAFPLGDVTPTLNDYSPTTC
ncbi:hypothetical protein Tco_1299681, partial [Tanacetum coccineum]